jgi:hypothetical protein
MITIGFTRPKIKLGATDAVAPEQTIFSVKNITLLGAGLALGIILKQQNEIHTLKRTVTVLQEIIR